MSDFIITKSNKAKREISTQKPKVLQVNTLKDLVDIIGEKIAVSKIQAQLTIDFRANIRSMLESGDINKQEFSNSDEYIQSIDFKDWKPETRIRKSKEEKAIELLSKLSPEELKIVLERTTKT